MNRGLQKLRIGLPLVLALAALGLAGSNVWAYMYSITDLGNAPPYYLYYDISNAWGLNATGDVVGSCGGVAALWTNDGTRIALLGALPGGGSSLAYAVNASGQVVGESTTSGPQAHAFLYSGSPMTDLGTLDGTNNYSGARGINDSGDIVGGSFPAKSDEHAFSYSGGTMSDLSTLGGSYSSACGINSLGQIVGASTTASGQEDAFLYSGGTMEVLGAIPGSWCLAYGVNSSGEAAGWGSVSGTIHALLYSGGGGGMTDLGTLTGGDASWAYGINNSDQIVGYGTIADGSDHAFLYSGGSMLDLNDLIPSGSSWTLQAAHGINDSGDICGEGISPSGYTHAFLLTLQNQNIPEPSTFALVGVGLALLVARRRRKQA
jgi:probable HAF family extracellular repeat protein